jgi:hypothetical protein
VLHNPHRRESVLPEATLPDAAFSCYPSDGGQPFRRRQATREERLYHTPSGREVVIADGKRPYGVQVVGQHDPGIDDERARTSNAPNRIAQHVDAFVEESIATALQEIDGEEIAAAGIRGADSRASLLRVSLCYDTRCYHSAEYAFSYSALL